MVINMKGKKLTKKEEKEIVNGYALYGSIRATAKNLHHAETTVARVIHRNGNDDKLEEIGEIKKETVEEEFAEFVGAVTHQAKRVVCKAFDRLEATLDDPTSRITARDLATIIGIVVDKMRDIRDRNAGSEEDRGIIILPEADLFDED